MDYLSFYFLHLHGTIYLSLRFWLRVQSLVSRGGDEQPCNLWVIKLQEEAVATASASANLGSARAALRLNLPVVPTCRTRSNAVTSNR